MLFNVAQLMKEHTGAARKQSIRVPAAELDRETGAIDDLAGVVKLLRTVEGVLVTGAMTTQVMLTCDRCLDEFAQVVEFELEDEFKPSIDIVSGASVPVDPFDQDNLIDDHHILDLTEVIRQRILLNLPLHPVCRPACRGLCPTCGQNRNEGACRCRVEGTDPRWEALRDLLR
ncbi:MAG: DUF177 domain-containing protein [Chloroflexi bacterium]|nr:DUF177 domain-containing protein [Chloroflexota bacterium]